MEVMLQLRCQTEEGYNTSMLKKWQWNAANTMLSCQDNVKAPPVLFYEHPSLMSKLRCSGVSSN